MVRGAVKLIGIGSALYTIAAIGKNSAMYGLAEAKYEHGEYLTDSFMKHNAGDGDVMKEGIKGWWWKVVLDEKISPFYFKIKMVAKEVVKQVANYAVPIALTAGALSGIPVVSPVCGAGLLLVGARAFLGDIVGIGEE